VVLSTAIETGFEGSCRCCLLYELKLRGLIDKVTQDSIHSVDCMESFYKYM